MNQFLRVSAQRLTSYVDPLIGSGGHGHVFVDASVPLGGVQLGPSNIYIGRFRSMGTRMASGKTPV